MQVKNRDKLKKYLDKRKIFTSIHYPIPIHLQPAAKKLKIKFNDLKEIELQSKKIITLPVNQFLSEKESRDIISMIVYNTRVGSLSHYQVYIKDRIIKESLHTLDYYNLKHKLRYKHAELHVARFAQIWLERYYSPGGRGYFKLEKRWNRRVNPEENEQRG